MTVVYGVDTSEPVTPLQVRDAITLCFTQAHCEDTGLTGTDLNSDYCTSLIKKFMTDNQDDFDHPNKASLTRLISSLQSYSQNFRDPSIVAKHASEIMPLLNLLS